MVLCDDSLSRPLQVSENSEENRVRRPLGLCLDRRAQSWRPGLAGGFEPMASELRAAVPNPHPGPLPAGWPSHLACLFILSHCKLLKFFLIFSSSSKEFEQMIFSYQTIGSWLWTLHVFVVQCPCVCALVRDEHAGIWPAQPQGLLWWESATRAVSQDSKVFTSCNTFFRF